MPESRGNKVFRIQLTLPVVLLLTTLSTFSLAAAFYLGMVTEKSMQRPPCLLYTSPSPRDRTRSRMPSSA